MQEIELLSPARNSEIGIAAIDCGADSVYIAAPKYGARAQAGNSFEDIARLCSYAHKFRAKIYLTLNTILYENELKEAQDYLWEAYRNGIDAVIVQDLALLKMDRPPIPLYASTQTDIRTPEKAALLEKLGFDRLILARELSLKQIREIRKATTIPLESFVHGALCVCYSGQCYLSQHITGRSANRGECAQMCRSEYNLLDQDGNILARKTPLLSLKDMNRCSRLEDLIDAGITSFKIEGRLKNISYVKNIVSLYDRALNKIIAEKNKGGEKFRRSSLGRSRIDFTPDAEKTFNRGYTDYFLDGKRFDWKSRDAAKGMGEYIGTVTQIKGGGKSFTSFTYEGDKALHNSDGICFAGEGRVISGNRANKVNGKTVELFTKDIEFKKGDSIYRNFDSEFEKSLEYTKPRIIDIPISVTPKKDSIKIKAVLSDKEKEFSFPINGDEAVSPDKAKDLIKRQLGKTSLQFSFTVKDLDGEKVWFYRTSGLNAIRAELAEKLSQIVEEEHEKERNIPNKRPEIKDLEALASKAFKDGGGSYLRNCSNSLSKSIYQELGIKDIQPSYEQEPPKDAILMRCKYCIRYQIGMCKKESKDILRLYLKNGNNTLSLEFDCSKCEMLVLPVE
ncbi:MAG: DUF3656 domain-containing protein [Bacteroidales bacterium]|nr:DUF3656 domain-containing protein [Bacteroidales bacterium]